MTQRKLHCRRTASRGAEDRGAFDVQRVEKAGMGVGLRGRRSIRRQWCAQIAEPRDCDYAKAAARERFGELEPLIEAATGAVYRQQRWARSHDCVLDRPAARLSDLAASRNTLVRLADSATVTRVCQSEQSREKYRGQDK